MPDTVRDECYAVAAQFPTPTVLRAVTLAERGQITWQQVHGLFSSALADATEAAKPTRFCTECDEPEGSQWAQPYCTYPEDV